MRSAELARLAGVTVRTLRHYHHIGLLAEPRRLSNGYRVYRMQDLTRLLRIKQLSGLGVPLEQMTGILDAPGPGPGPGEDVGAADPAKESDADDARGADAVQVLDDLDDQLARQIERLTQQREVIAQLRAHRAAPDLPSELAPFYAIFTMAGYPRHLAEIDRDQAVLLHHFADESGRAYLIAVYERMRDQPELLGAMTEVSRGFADLTEDSAQADVTALVERAIDLLNGTMGDLMDAGADVDLGAAAELLDDYGNETHNSGQRAFLRLLTERLGD